MRLSRSGSLFSLSGRSAVPLCWQGGGRRERGERTPARQGGRNRSTPNQSFQRASASRAPSAFGTLRRASDSLRGGAGRRLIRLEGPRSRAGSRLARERGRGCRWPISGRRQVVRTHIVQTGVSLGVCERAGGRLSSELDGVPAALARVMRNSIDASERCQDINASSEPALRQCEAQPGRGVRRGWEGSSPASPLRECARSTRH